MSADRLSDVTSHLTCPSCAADLQVESTTCAECGSVRCWDCGSANATDEAFCRRCGVWLVGREPVSDRAQGSAVRPKAGLVTSLPVTRPVTPQPIVAAPLLVEPERRRRGRWVAATLMVALAVVAVGAMVTLDAGRPANPPSIAAVLPPDTDGAPAEGTPAASLPAADPTPVTLPSRRPARSTTAELADLASVDRRAKGEAASRVEVDDGVDVGRSEPIDLAERRDPPAPARTRSGWVCDDAIRVTDARGSRWSVDRVSFRAMGAYERVVLHLDRQGPGGAAATASGKVFATSAVEAFAPAAARPTSGRMTIGIELAGGIRSGLELRRFRPQGLQTIRELSIYRTGPESRVLISVASDGCFRMRAPSWGSGSGAATSAQLIVDVRR